MIEVTALVIVHEGDDAMVIICNIILKNIDVYVTLTQRDLEAYVTCYGLLCNMLWVVT